MQQEKLTAKQWRSTKQKKKNKYNSKATYYKGERFDSKLEAEYCKKLDIAKKATYKKERVLKYRRQVPYKIFSKKGFLLFTYRLDFEVAYSDGRIEFIDTKGFLTPMSKMKIKAVEQEYNIEIKLVKK